MLDLKGGSWQQSDGLLPRAVAFPQKSKSNKGDKERQVFRLGFFHLCPQDITSFLIQTDTNDVKTSRK